MSWERFAPWCERHQDGIFWWSVAALALFHLCGL